MQTPYHPHLQLVCPSCGGVLVPAARDELRCEREGTSYRKHAGIWDTVAPAREKHFRRFITDYDQIRRMEGRGCRDSRYFRRLPYEDTTGRFSRDWRIRAASFDCFVTRILEPMERPDEDPAGLRRLRVLDLGAGNGWMSARLARRGHDVVAVDLRTDGEDGLGAHVHYDVHFPCFRAEFDRLPFDTAAFDLVVFNASLHYAEDYERSLREALRVMRENGRLALVDTPFYRNESSARKMVRQRRDRFARKYGTASDSIHSEEYLTAKRLRQISACLGITWIRHVPRFGVRWRIRRLASRVRNRREPARFAVIQGLTGLDSGTAGNDLRPHSGERHRAGLQRLGRLGLRLRYLAMQRSQLRRGAHLTVGGLRLRIAPGVFHPAVFRSGIFLAELLLDDLLKAGARVLDLGSGSGLCGIAAATRGAAVTAVDINPKAVACTRENARLNGVELCVREADLFDGVGRFDVVLFNPPYFAGRPESTFDLAWRSDDLVDRFSSELVQHLHPGGFALVVLSSDGQGRDYLQRFAADGLRIARVAERRYWSERLAVFRLSNEAYAR